MSADMGLSIIAAPLGAGLLVVASHVLLGREVLGRGIVFIDLCIAQVAALGVIFAHSLHLPDAHWLVQLVAFGSALAAAALLQFTESHWRQWQEAIIGCLYVVSACLALLVLSHDPHGAEQLKSLLTGQILWVAPTQLWPLLVATAVVLLAWYLLPAWRQRLFYFLFALAITTSVQQVGVFLVFASLILPALAVIGMQRTGLWLGYALGALGYTLGLLLSLHWDLPAGPLVVCMLAATALAVALLRSLYAKWS